MGMGRKTPILSPLVPGPPRPPGPSKERARGWQAVDQCPLPPPSQCYFKHHLMFDAHLFGLICNILVQFLSSYKHSRSSSNVSFNVINIVLIMLSTFLNSILFSSKLVRCYRTLTLFVCIRLTYGKNSLYVFYHSQGPIEDI